MMDPTEIEMCVIDCLLDDEVENLEMITQALNDVDPAGWRAARGRGFTGDEVRAALIRRIRTGCITPCAEQGPTFTLAPIACHDVGTKVPWELVWFHLEPIGRNAFTQWWESQGQKKYPKP